MENMHMKSLKGTQTEKNLLTAFAGESQARNRYDYFATQAEKDGLIWVRNIFLETALQEKAHAKRLFQFLEGGEVEITAAYPAGVIAGSEANLLEAAAGEHYENTEMYPGFADMAEKEGFKEIACVLRNIAAAETYHEKRFLTLAKALKEGTMFVRTGKTTWRCLNCGYLVTAETAPQMCAACAYPQAYFEELYFQF